MDAHGQRLREGLRHRLRRGAWRLERTTVGFGGWRWHHHDMWYVYFTMFNPRKFRSQTSDNIQMKSRGGKSQRREEKRREEKEAEERRCRCAKRLQSHYSCVFPMTCGSGGSKSRLAKAAGAEPSGQMRDEKLHANCGAKRVSKSKCRKHSSFGALDVEKVHAVVARIIFQSKNVQNVQKLKKSRRIASFSRLQRERERER